MTKRQTIYAKIIANKDKIEKLLADNLELERKSYLLSDDKQQYIEKEETKKEGKKNVTRLVGRIHWIETFTDGDTGKKHPIERSRVVKIDGEWI